MHTLRVNTINIHSFEASIISAKGKCRIVPDYKYYVDRYIVNEFKKWLFRKHNKCKSTQMEEVHIPSNQNKL